MELNETLVFYGVVGVAMAAAVCLRRDASGILPWSFRIATAVLFWPLYLPLLLARPETPVTPPAQPAADAGDAMARAIAQVEAELDAAFASLDGWAEDVLARETERISELRAAWNAQAARIREMDRLLAQPQFAPSQAADASESELSADGRSGGSNDRRRQSELARHKNIERLREVRHQAHAELMATLAWVRELVSMIHLAKFTGAPASRAEELVAQIAAAVEGVSAVTWQQEVEPLNRSTVQPFNSPTRKERNPWESFDASTTSSLRI